MGVKKSKKKESTDFEKLFSGEKVEGYTIRPFSLGDIEKLTPWFKKVAVKYLESGGDPNFSDFSNDRLKSLLLSLDFLPEIFELLSIYLDEPIDTIRKFDLDKAQKIILSLFVKNFEYLKNSFRLVTGALVKLRTKSS